METRIIYRKPKGKQSVFQIFTTYRQNKKVINGLEQVKKLHVSAVDISEVQDTKKIAVVCDEVALYGITSDNSVSDFRYVTAKEELCNPDKIHCISIKRRGFAPEKLRMEVYQALLEGAQGIQYDSLYEIAVNTNGDKGPYFDYVEDMNYRIKEIGRTLMALEKKENDVLADETISSACTIGQFEDGEGNPYLFVQNKDWKSNDKRAFKLKFKKNMHVYRVNPHNGKQVLVKENVGEMCLLMMPGDGDLLRFQDANEDTYLIEYVLKI